MSGSKAKAARRAATARADEALAAIYAQIPDAGCKGLCADACGPIGMSEHERRRLTAAGYDVPALHTPQDIARAVTELPTCPALADDRCGAYDARPTLCRLYGSAEGLPCPHGCEPSGGVLPRDVAGGLLRESLRVGGR
jgi:hypothetical protein